mmetsp:Transcript_8454/g.20785  ORF Transcript_8454/g.20785 Transcript_8454/m.20785 type:complete len:241 (+) Transcript_8454:388-1110(+)
MVVFSWMASFISEEASLQSSLRSFLIAPTAAEDDDGRPAMSAHKRVWICRQPSLYSATSNPKRRTLDRRREDTSSLESKPFFNSGGIPLSFSSRRKFLQRSFRATVSSVSKRSACLVSEFSRASRIRVLIIRCHSLAEAIDATVAAPAETVGEQARNLCVFPSPLTSSKPSFRVLAWNGPSKVASASKIRPWDGAISIVLVSKSGVFSSSCTFSSSSRSKNSSGRTTLGTYQKSSCVKTQ